MTEAEPEDTVVRVIPGSRPRPVASDRARVRRGVEGRQRVATAVTGTVGATGGAVGDAVGVGHAPELVGGAGLEGAVEETAGWAGGLGSVETAQETLAPSFHGTETSQDEARPGRLRRWATGVRAVSQAIDRPVSAAGVLTSSSVHLETKRPLLVRLLRLRHVAPTGWQRAAVGDLPILAAVLLVLADLATAWTILVLPAVVLGLVKFHDVVASRLESPPPRLLPPRPFGDIDPGV